MQREHFSLFYVMLFHERFPSESLFFSPPKHFEKPQKRKISVRCMKSKKRASGEVRCRASFFALVFNASFDNKWSVLKVTFKAFHTCSVLARETLKIASRKHIKPPWKMIFIFPLSHIFSTSSSYPKNNLESKSFSHINWSRKKRTIPERGWPRQKKKIS